MGTWWYPCHGEYQIYLVMINRWCLIPLFPLVASFQPSWSLASIFVLMLSWHLHLPLCYHLCLDKVQRIGINGESLFSRHLSFLLEPLKWASNQSLWLFSYVLHTAAALISVCNVKLPLLDSGKDKGTAGMQDLQNLILPLAPVMQSTIKECSGTQASFTDPGFQHQCLLGSCPLIKPSIGAKI